MITINDDNSWNLQFDWATLHPNECPPPWSDGGYAWDIPALWIIDGSTNTLAQWTQAFTVSVDGTVTVAKFGHTVARTTNDVSTID